MSIGEDPRLRSAFEIDDLKARGFEGFVPMGELTLQPAQIPGSSGVYVIVRTETDEPGFLERSGGGWWKGKDPTVTHEKLRAKWVDGAQTVYIGKAASLRERLDLLIRFSRGEPIMHWGGRYLWQLERCETLLVAWRVEPDFAGTETDMIEEFIQVYGGLPFANLRRGDRRRS